MSDYEMLCEMEKDNPKMMNKSMSVEDTLAQRGSVYGEFSEQVRTVSRIVKSMHDAYKAKHKDNPDTDLVIEWTYLAIKMARIAVSPDHIDSYHDLAGYATLMERERVK